MKEGQHTSVDVLADLVLDSALVGSRHGLLLDGAAAVVEAVVLVHRLLERITFPAEHV